MSDVSTHRWQLNAVIPGKNRNQLPNRLYSGDNLLLMQALLPEFEGKIDLIYADPPFDVGTDFTMQLHPGRANGAVKQSLEITAYPDRWGDGIHSYDTMMRRRLELMYRLLSNRGALWLHCDYRTNHRLRTMLDDIFGRPMVNEIIWAYGAGGNPKTSFPRKHDYLLVYSKSGTIMLNKSEPIMRVPYDQSTLATHYRSLDDDGRRYRAQIKNGKEYRTYADEGKLVTDVWTDIGGQLATSPISRETTGFASQKPEKLLERIIAGTTDPDWLIADFFCGSGTTGAVASRLGRRWLMVDSGHPAMHATMVRLLRQRDKISAGNTIEIYASTDPDGSAGADSNLPEFSEPTITIDSVRANDTLALHLQRFDTSVLSAPDRIKDQLDALLKADGRNLVDYWAVSLEDTPTAPFRYDFLQARTRTDRVLSDRITLPLSAIADKQAVRVMITTIFGHRFTVTHRLDRS